ncbi:MAG: hypothetical protein HYT93_03780 [Parcubacteria group bacterium]|nr:hypothetical protein [Parcubacteria group bacterium]
MAKRRVQVFKKKGAEEVFDHVVVVESRSSSADLLRLINDQGTVVINSAELLDAPYDRSPQLPSQGGAESVGMRKAAHLASEGFELRRELNFRRGKGHDPKHRVVHDRNRRRQRKQKH